MYVWRICRERYVATAFSGIGAQLGSARWNSAGTPMVYSAEHLSLAAMEFFVHLDGEDEPDDLIALCASIPCDEAAMRAKREALAKSLLREWKKDMAETQRLGDAWIRSSSSLVMSVPSAVISGEWNLLLNPDHAAAKGIEIVSTEAFRFDPRLLKRQN